MNYLDISAGWGDRLYAATTMGMNYLGFDPNESLQEGYDGIIATCQRKKATQQVLPIPMETGEDAMRRFTDVHGLFDICLSSPPFYTLEIYEGAQQSVQLYPAFDLWMVQFLFRALFLAWKYIRVGGKLAVNINDLQNYKMVRPMCLFVADYCLSVEFEGVLEFCGKHTERFTPAAVYCWTKKQGDHRATTSSASKASLATLYPELDALWNQM